MTARTGLEIFTHADDLLFRIAEAEDVDKFAILISRGPKHQYKPLLSSEPEFETPDKARAAIMETLEVITEKARETLTDDTNIVTQIVNPDGRPVSDMENTLTDDLLEDIEEELRDSNTANTAKMLG